MALALFGAAVFAQEPPKTASYLKDFDFLWTTLRDQVPGEILRVKGVDWNAVRKEFEPKVRAAKDDREFVRLCAWAVMRLRDGHAWVSCPTVKPEEIYGTEETRSNPGIGLVECGGRLELAILTVLGPAAQAGIERGMVVKKINGEPASAWSDKAYVSAWAGGGYSSDRAARHAAIWNLLSGPKDSEVTVEVEGKDRATKTVTLKRSWGRLLRCPKLQDYVSVGAIRTQGSCGWATLENDIGYLQIHDFRGGDGGKADIEAALQDLGAAKGLIVDVRGNGGGGVPQVAWPTKPTVLIIDPGTFSAGEGFAAYFGWSKETPKGHPDLRIVGQGTAGSSSAKAEAKVPSGLFSFGYSTRGRKGVVNCGPGGMIEFYGVHPDEPVLPDAADLRAGKDTCLERAKALLAMRLAGRPWPAAKR